jgi:hypothetical protein
MGRNVRYDTVCTIEGLCITEDKQQEAGQAILIALAHQNIEIDSVTICFTTEGS